MKKIFSAVTALSLFLFPVMASARIVGAAPKNPDAACWYGQQGHVGGSQTGAEICVDASGNVVPTAANAQSVGSAALPFSGVFTNALSAVSPAISGLLTFSPKTYVTVGAVGSSIAVTSSREDIVPTGNATLLLTSTPTIATLGVASGTVLILSSISSVIVALQDAGTLTNSGLRLGTATINIKQYKTLTLIFDADDGYWRAVSYGND